MECQFIKKDGKQCLTWAIVGSNYCYWHTTDERYVKLRKEKASLGGKRAHISVGGMPTKGIMRLDKPEKAIELLKFVIREVVQDRMDIRKGDFLVTAVRDLLTAVEKVDLEQRVRKLEEVIKKDVGD